jgi:hypothetical protein
MKVWVNIPTLLRDCLEAAARGMFLNDMPDDYPTLTDDQIEKLCDDIDTRFMLELDNCVVFPERPNA